MLVLTRLLYNYDEVKINLLLSLLTKKEFREVIFWSSEIYYSGFKEELWKYIWKIYYDFYALLLTSKEIKIQYEKYLKTDKLKDSFKNISKTLFILFHSKVSFDVFIVNNFYKTRKLAKKTIEKMKFSNIEKMLKFFIEKRLLKKFVIKLKQALQINKGKTIKFIMKEFGNHEIDNHEIENSCLFQKLFIISQKKPDKKKPDKKKPDKKKPDKKKPRIKMSKLQKAYALKLTSVAFEKHNLKYEILKKMRHYSISEYTNSFKLEREKLDLKKNFIENWEYYANFSPFWNKKIKLYKGKIKNKKIVFKDDDCYEEFYENYNLEPGEQSVNIQQKSIKNLQKYNTTELIVKLFGDKPLLLELDNKIDFQKVIY